MKVENVLIFCIIFVVFASILIIYTEGQKSVIAKNDTQKPSYAITFNNNNQPSLTFVSETEYTNADEYGSTIIKLTDFKGDKINTSCYEQILYPNKSIYVAWSLMTQHAEYSNYYYTFALPQVYGIFDQEVRCAVSNKNISLGKGFHMSNLTDKIQADSRVDVMTMVS